MFTKIVDDEISLKLKEYQDNVEFFQLIDASRKHLRPFMVWVNSVQSVENVEEVTQQHLLEFVNKKAMHCLILYKGKIAGSISLQDFDWTTRSAEIGYWLGSDFTGRGIMTRSVSTLLDYAFSELDLHKVEIWAAEENTKSRQIPERLGFTQEGKRRDNEYINGKYLTMVIYGLLKDEWQQMKYVF
ncbi:GNAT family N-acetyltransferase [Alkalibacterium kapii]|uniref:50S ribosomal protein L7 serine acetyltransferase n=1 Tax=Alkalibacterium kapii TaxID=426704 RepID=A0A511AY87_9LACT|nr:GNAT family protein [Alkalibacterium kapii]GEK90567.1 50S ribosomal protein L7 serine acetyltransferase [Alkalibacterium kapii]